MRFSASVPGVRRLITLVMAEVVVDLSVPHALLASSMGTNFLRGLAWLGPFGSLYLGSL